MKTDDLIALLAADAQPVPRHAAAHRLAWGLAAALPFSVLLMLVGYGLRPGLLASLALPMPLLKVLLPAAIATAGFVAVARLGRPGVAARGAWWGMVLPVAVIWAMGIVSWTTAAPEARPELLWGQTWRTCAFSISAMALPVFVAAIVVLRSLAPTRPVLAGAAAGAFAGGAGAAVYALHCPEFGPPFLAVWYVLGMAIPVAAGALLGPKLLRW
ncbi:MAG: DUF1109 domain-containing protein [Burkholderiales bacterium]|nr:DUF1109 domain-containing protein [Burkholderiales bacterium]